MAAYTDEVGQRIRRAREANTTLSQENAAHKIGVSTKQYGRWERGLSTPRPANFERIAEVLGVDITDLRGEPPAITEHELAAQLGRIERKLDALLRAASLNPDVFDADSSADIEHAAAGPTELLGGEAGANPRAKRAPARKRRAS